MLLYKASYIKSIKPCGFQQKPARIMQVQHLETRKSIIKDVFFHLVQPEQVIFPSAMEDVSFLSKFLLF